MSILNTLGYSFIVSDEIWFRIAGSLSKCFIYSATKANGQIAFKFYYIVVFSIFTSTTYYLIDVLLLAFLAWYGDVLLWKAPGNKEQNTSSNRARSFFCFFFLMLLMRRL